MMGRLLRALIVLAGLALGSCMTVPRPARMAYLKVVAEPKPPPRSKLAKELDDDIPF